MSSHQNDIVGDNKENVDSAATTDVEVSNDDVMDDSLMDAQQDDDSSSEDEEGGFCLLFNIP